MKVQNESTYLKGLISSYAEEGKKYRQINIELVIRKRRQEYGEFYFFTCKLPEIANLEDFQLLIPFIYSYPENIIEEASCIFKIMDEHMKECLSFNNYVLPELRIFDITQKIFLVPFHKEEEDKRRLILKLGITARMDIKMNNIKISSKDQTIESNNIYIYIYSYKREKCRM